MTRTKNAERKARPQDAEAADHDENFDRPDADTAEQGGAPHEQAAPASTRERAVQNDAKHGFSQDSGYATSGGPAKGAARTPKRS